MQTTTLLRPHQGRAGGLKCVRRRVWDVMGAAHTVVATTNDDALRIAACSALTEAARLYKTLLPHAAERE